MNITVKIAFTSIGAYFALLVQSSAIVDNNSNGVCDVWEHKYNATALVANVAARAADEDGDGQTNEDEALAGTNPRDSNSVHRIDLISKTGADITLQCPTEKGKLYQVASSQHLKPLSWINQGGAQVANSSSMSTVVSGQSLEKLFYRISVSDIDTDGDGVPNWVEEQMEGFDPNNGDSFGSETSNNDLNVLHALLNALSGGEVTIETTVTDAYEKEGTPASFTVKRSGDTTYPHTVFLNPSGHIDPTKGSVTASDYTLKDVANNVLSGAVTIPAGADSVVIFCHPAIDTRIEVPETLTCTIGGTAQSASVRICDATNTIQNQRTFIAQLSPEGGAETGASGLSTILLQGDNEIGRVALTFYGLTSPQSSVHIHIKNPVTGPHVESLPMGQIEEILHPWTVRAAQFLNTDQSVLDALFASQLYVNVHSSNYPMGEIRGDYSLATGSTTLVTPEAPPAISLLTGDELDRDIARFLIQCTFGPTAEMINELRDLVNSAPHNGNRISAYGAWIDAQMQIPSPDMQPYLHAADAQHFYLGGIPGSPEFDQTEPRGRNRSRAWWLLARHAPDQFRQRMAFALSEIFVTSDKESTVAEYHYGHGHYYDMLKNNGFGNFRDILEDVSTHPIMGQYLSLLRNQKAIVDSGGNILVSPDENYARELMQLFSIGLVKLHEDGSLIINTAGLPIPTYDQDDITAMARVFTGWSFSKRNEPYNSDQIIDNTIFNWANGARYNQAQWTHRMANFSQYHDSGAKDMPVLGLSISEGGDGESDLDAVLDYLAAHPNTAPFICRRLIQRFVTSNPSAGYIYRISQTWKSTNGNIGAVIKAILLDYEARSIQATQLHAYGKKKEPLIHAVATARALNATSKLPLKDIDPTDTAIVNLANYSPNPDELGKFPDLTLDRMPSGITRMRMPTTEASLAQTPLSAPSVFNWFLPDYSLAGPLAEAGLSSPEFQIATESTVFRNVNFYFLFVYYGVEGEDFPSQDALDEQGNPHPVYNPYGYATDAHHVTPDESFSLSAVQAYLAIMDTNGDGKVSSEDTTFNNRLNIVAACEAMVDHLDLLLCAGRLKADYGSGYIPETVRLSNPRDIFIHAVSNYSVEWDDDTEFNQTKVLMGRLKLAAYLIVTSPTAMIQK